MERTSTASEWRERANFCWIFSFASLYIICIGYEIELGFLFSVSLRAVCSLDCALWPSYKWDWLRCEDSAMFRWPRTHAECTNALRCSVWRRPANVLPFGQCCFCIIDNNRIEKPKSGIYGPAKYDNFSRGQQASPTSSVIACRSSRSLQFQFNILAVINRKSNERTWSGRERSQRGNSLIEIVFLRHR